MTEIAIYERITDIRAELLDVIGEIDSTTPPPETGNTVMQDDLIMVANRLGRVAAQLRPDRPSPGAGASTASS